MQNSLMGCSSTLCLHPSVTSSDASIGHEEGLVRFPSLFPTSASPSLSATCVHSGSDPAWSVKYHFLHTPSRNIQFRGRTSDRCELDRPIGGGWENGFSFYIELSPSCIVRRGLHVRRERVVRANRLIVTQIEAADRDLSMTFQGIL